MMGNPGAGALLDVFQRNPFVRTVFGFEEGTKQAHLDYRSLLVELPLVQWAEFGPLHSADMRLLGAEFAAGLVHSKTF